MDVKMKTLIAVPAMDMLHTRFFYSFVNMRRVGLSRVSVVSNSLVYDARNMLAAEAIDEGCDRVLWLDSDMVFEADLMERLSADMDEGREYVSGLFFRRVEPSQPIIMPILQAGEQPHTYTDYPRDTIFKIGASGFGAVMTSTDLLKRVWDKYGAPFTPAYGHGEDYAFCYRARKLGAELWCDSRIKVGHIGQVVFGERD